jgi:hypothetical protein
MRRCSMRTHEQPISSLQRLAVPALGLVLMLLGGVVAGVFRELVAPWAAVTEADDELALARAANSHQSDAVSARAMQQLAARADVAHARLTLWEDPAFLQSPLQVMQMQIDQLADQVLELTHRADNAPPIDRR